MSPFCFYFFVYPNDIDDQDVLYFLATIETKRAVLGVSPSSNDQQLAVVENPLDTTGSSEESIVRLYDVGRHKAEDEDIDDEDNDDDDDDEDGEEDGIGFDR